MCFWFWVFCILGFFWGGNFLIEDGVGDFIDKGFIVNKFLLDWVVLSVEDKRLKGWVGR